MTDRFDFSLKHFNFHKKTELLRKEVLFSRQGQKERKEVKRKEERAREVLYMAENNFSHV